MLLPILLLSTVFGLFGRKNSNMANPWSRENTQYWIAQLENRIEDIDYYLNRAVEWCESNEIYNEQIVFACASMTVIWVSHMRGEPISRREMLEVLGVEDWDQAEDLEYSLGSDYHDYDFEELMQAVVSQFY